MKKHSRCTYACILLDGDEDCDLLHDTPVLSTGRTPHDKQNRSCHDYNQNPVMSTGGDQRQEGPTDRQLQIDYV